MQIRTVYRSLAALAASAFLFACGGSHQKGAAAPEPDPWAGYQGTFAGPIAQPAHAVGASVRSEPAKEEATAMVPESTSPAEASATPKPAETKKAAASRGPSKKAAKKALAKK